MLSIAPERPIAPVILEILALVDHVAQPAGLDYFVTGATARDILLFHVFGLDAGRATRDVDLAVALDSWDDFDALKARLVGTGTVTADANQPHRLFHEMVAEARRYPFDLLPFGGLERSPGEIAWPPDLSVVMKVAGYREALAAAERVELRPGLVVRVASLPGLAVLKVFAWNDRGLEDSRDARDLAALLRSYWEAGNEDRLYGDEMPLLAAAAHDVELAGAQLLGKDTARIISPSTHAQVIEVLSDAPRRQRLAGDMAQAFRDARDPVAAAETVIAQFRSGLEIGVDRARADREK